MSYEPDVVYSHPVLKTSVFSVKYDWATRTADIYCGGPTDMGGAIKFVTDIDEHAVLIKAHSNAPDPLDDYGTGYEKTRNGWRAFRLTTPRSGTND